MSLSIPELVAYVRTDFEGRTALPPLSIALSTVDVLFGDWNVDQHGAANVVIFGLGDFGIGPPGMSNSPGMMPIPQELAEAVLGDGTQGGARPLLDRQQQVKVWVHAAPPADYSETAWAQTCQEYTASLLDATLAAVMRATSGSTGQWGVGKWLVPERQEFTYGSVATFYFTLPIPVIDDVYEIVQGDPETSEVNLYATINGVDYLADQTPEQTP